MPPNRIIAMVADHYQIPVKEMVGPRRPHHLAFPRQIAMVLLCESGLTTTVTGGYFNDRDHTTVSYAKKAIADRLYYDTQFSEVISGFRQRISNAA